MNIAYKRLLDFEIKPSLHRIAIMQYLMENYTHPCADTIYENLYPKIPTLSKTTVYNSLKLFEDKGAIQSISIDEKNLRFDADISNHAHFKCNKCGLIADFKIKENNIKVENKKKFKINNTSIFLYGLCDKCK